MIGIGGLSLVLHRRTAIVVGLICLWLSTVGSMHHDEVLGFAANPHSRATIGRTIPLPQQGPCVACEWEQMTGASHTPTLTMLMLPGVQALALIPRLAAPIIQRHFDYTSLRAPPVA